MNPAYDVYVVGDYCLDLIFTGLPGLPVLGTEIEAKGFNMTPGGTCNSVIAMHRLGLKVLWAADFGNDSFSRFILDYLEKEGVDSSFFVHSKGSMRKITVSLSYPQDRAFIAYYDPEPAMIAGLKMFPQANSRAVYIPGFYCGPGLKLGRDIATRKHMKIIMDGNSNQNFSLKDKKVQNAIRMVDLFLLNRDESRRFTGETSIEKALDCLSQFCSTIIIKSGAEGAYGISQGKKYHQKAITVKAIDTTGAGDCFNAGFIKAWLAEKPIDECLKWGNIAGGLSTLGLGGIDHVTRENDILKVLRNWKVK